MDVPLLAKDVRLHQLFATITGGATIRSERLHQCWGLLSETKCVGDNFEILVTVLMFLPLSSIFQHWRRAPTTKR